MRKEAKKKSLGATRWVLREVPRKEESSQLIEDTPELLTAERTRRLPGIVETGKKDGGVSAGQAFDTTDDNVLICLAWNSEAVVLTLRRPACLGNTYTRVSDSGCT